MSDNESLPPLSDDESLPDLIDLEEENNEEEKNNEEENSIEVRSIFLQNEEIEETVREMVDQILSSNEFQTYYFSTDDDLFTFAINIIDDEDVLNETLVQSLEECESLRKNENVNIEFNDYKCESETMDCCCICMNKIYKNDIITTINCNHTFHLNCIKEWSQYKADCPVCREKI